MTGSQALVRARIEWGKNGYVFAARTREGTRSFNVGVLDGVGGFRFFRVEGSGPSYEAAFEAAEEKRRRLRIDLKARELYEFVEAYHAAPETMDYGSLDLQAERLVNYVRHGRTS